MTDWNPELIEWCIKLTDGARPDAQTTLASSKLNALANMALTERKRAEQSDAWPGSYAEYCLVSKNQQVRRLANIAIAEHKRAAKHVGEQMSGMWVCSCCGERGPDIESGRWRWAGDHWEHKCKGGSEQGGHEPARYFGPQPEPCPACAGVQGLKAGGVAVLVSLLEVMRDTTDRPSLYDECNAALDGVTLED